MNVCAFDDVELKEFDTIPLIREMAEIVYETLGQGHSESVYHHAMEVIMRDRKLSYTSEAVVPINFMGKCVGFHRLDTVIQFPGNDPCVLEYKSISRLRDQEEQQVQNYLKTTGYHLGVLINFGPSLEIKTVTSCKSSSLSPPYRSPTQPDSSDLPSDIPSLV